MTPEPKPQAFTLPQAVPKPLWRPPHAGIPETGDQRRAVRDLLRAYAARTPLVTPLSLEELGTHVETILAEHPELDPSWHDWMAVLLNNEAWRDDLAAIPFERRLLLLSKCMRVEEKCPATFDEFGLLCKSCGLCSIQELTEQAEQLGYAVLTAEGSAIVMAMLQSGQIECVIGVSCLSVMERAFPHAEAAAVPSIAVPLLQDDCKDCNVDLDWIWDYIHLTSDDTSARLDLDALRDQVDGWFGAAELAEIMGPASGSRTEAIAREWLAGRGKRWRPFLTVCAHRALTGRDETPAALRKVAIAVECFHKASLVHDDIEDDDDTRYDRPTLHVEHGVPVALNVGDFLLGEGYRLLAGSGAPPDVIADLVRRAADGHRTLCLGQGAELVWARDPQPLRAKQVLQIFADKTAPAFEIALTLGASLAGADDATMDVLRTYSEAVGIAYQIRDDLEDVELAKGDDLTALRPTLPLALAYDKSRKDDRALMTAAWRRQIDDVQAVRVREIVETGPALEKARDLLEAYKQEAARSLVGLSNPSLKGLLRRVIGKIFRLEVGSWCSEHEAQNLAAGVRSEPA